MVSTDGSRSVLGEGDLQPAEHGGGQVVEERAEGCERGEDHHVDAGDQGRTPITF